jgi:hypothetical protein
VKSSLLSFVALSALASAQPLFNGKDLSGWTPDVPSADGKPETPPSFIVRDGLLVSKGEPRGHLVSDKSYSNYKLEIDPHPRVRTAEPLQDVPEIDRGADERG